jgi:hypothetical protein
MDAVADKLEDAAKTLRKVLSKESPPREMLEEHMSWSLDDSGWV